MSNKISTKVNASKPAALSPQTEARTKIMSEANEEFRELYNRIRNTLLGEEQNVIRARYAIGELVYDMDVDESKYGARAVQRMEEVIGYDRSIIYNSLNFVKRYTKDQMEALLASRTSTGQPLLWTHVTHLMRVTDPDVREDLTTAALQQDLSPTELLNLIQKTQGKEMGRQSNAGKPMARPKSLKGYIDQQWVTVEQLLRRKDKVWAGAEKKGDKSFFDILADTPVDKIDDTMMTEMERLQKLFEKASFELDNHATKLLEARKRIEQSKLPAEEEEEEDELSEDALDNAEELPEEIDDDFDDDEDDDFDDEDDEDLEDDEDDDEEAIDDDEKPITNPRRVNPSERFKPGARFSKGGQRFSRRG
jgi:hypothetical protein